MDLHFAWRKCPSGEIQLYAIVCVIGLDVYCEVRPQSAGRYYWWVCPQVTTETRVHCLPWLRSSGFVSSDAAGAVAKAERYLRAHADALAGRLSVFDIWRPAIMQILMDEGARDVRDRWSATRKGEEAHLMLEEMLLR